MDLWTLALLAAAGLASGVLNVLAGGGSLLVMPVLVAAGFSGPAANGTTRVGILGQNLAAILRFSRGGQRLRRHEVLLVAAVLPGASIGSFVGAELDGPAFRWVLSGVMLGAWLWMASSWLSSWRRKRADPEPLPDTGDDDAADSDVKRRRPGPLAWIALVATGFYGGFLQAGVGLLLMAVLHRLFRYDLVRVNALKVWMVCVYTLVALPVFYWRASVSLPAGLALAVGTTTGGWLGARLTLKRGARLVRAVFTVALFALVVRLLWP